MERQAASFVQHPRCPYCREGVEPRQPKAACDACMSWHHDECWDEHGGCSACGEQAPVGTGQPQPEPRAHPRPARRASAPRRRARARPRGRLAAITRPAGIEISSDEHALHLTHRWGHPLGLVLSLPLCAGWIAAAFLSLTAPGMDAAGAPVVLLVLLMLAWACYGSLAWALNETRIEVTEGLLVLEHGPLPWPGRYRLRADVLQQLYCEEQVTSKGHRRYSLHALLPRGRRFLLLRGTREVLRFLEREIETWLGIENRRVRGEMR